MDTCRSRVSCCITCEGWLPFGTQLPRRGSGPDKQADILPSGILCRLLVETFRVARSQSWPAAGLDAAVVAAAWATREIESGSAFLGAVSFSLPSSDEKTCGSAHWDLPLSKSDIAAFGKARSLPCTCPQAGCPVRAMRHIVGASIDVRNSLCVDSTAECLLLVKSDGSAMAKRDMA